MQLGDKTGSYFMHGPKVLSLTFDKHALFCPPKLLREGLCGSRTDAPLHIEPAVDANDLTGDIRGLSGSEKSDGGRNFFRSAQPS